MQDSTVEYFPAAKLSEVAEGQPKLIHQENDDLVLFNVGGKLFCTSNICPHQHRSELHQGTLHGEEIACPVHGWTFSLETGKGVPNGRLRIYKVYVEDGTIYVEKPAKKFMF